jgi:hypothetical protein
MKIRAFVSVAALALVLLAVPAMAADGNLARVAINGNAIDWQPMTQNGFDLAVTGPNGFHFQDTFRSSDVPSLSGLEDGQYRYEIRALAELQHRNIVRDNDQGLTANTRGETQSGYFRVVGGAVMRQDTQEEANAPTPAAPQGGLQNAPAADQVILDDLIVDGSACIGMDCVNGESFGFDTLRLKENNLRIKAQDTSNSASFPSNDWQITFNDSSNGGANKFSIDDIDGGRTPFTIEASAPSNSLYVDDGGRVGLGKSTPVVELHIVDGDSPTIRLEQDGSSGFTAQTWDLAGNETNFFVRDVTNGSKLPFKVFPNAPTNALIIEGTTGDIGMGIQSPAYALHVQDSDGDTAITVEETSSTAATRTMLSLINNGGVRIDMNGAWQISATGGNLNFDDPDSATVDVRFVGNGGGIEVNGTGLAVPDYVFDASYELRTLDELAAFIKTNKHLPNVPSAQQVKENGMNIVTMPLNLLEKIEELTLYTLQQQEAIETLQAQNAELMKLVEASK